MNGIEVPRKDLSQEALGVVPLVSNRHLADALVEQRHRDGRRLSGGPMVRPKREFEALTLDIVEHDPRWGA